MGALSAGEAKPGNAAARTEPDPALLPMTGISKSFVGVPVLRDVSFDLRPGEVHVLAGENGAGKSTLMKIAAGVHTDYEGEIALLGLPSRFSSPQDAAARGISVIHQEMSLIDSMSVVDNIFLGRELTRSGTARQWTDRSAQLRKAREFCEQLDLDIDLSRLVEDYSLSVKNRIEIAKALAFNARIFIMTEPNSALRGREARRNRAGRAAFGARADPLDDRPRAEQAFPGAADRDRCRAAGDRRSLGAQARRDIDHEEILAGPGSVPFRPCRRDRRACRPGGLRKHRPASGYLRRIREARTGEGRDRRSAIRDPFAPPIGAAGPRVPDQRSQGYGPHPRPGSGGEHHAGVARGGVSSTLDETRDGVAGRRSACSRARDPGGGTLAGGRHALGRKPAEGRARSEERRV